MSGASQQILGVLVELGTPAGSDQPRALVHCTEDEIRNVKHVPMLRRVAIVALDDLNGSAVPPVVAECQGLREEVQRLKALMRRAVLVIGTREGDYADEFRAACADD